MAAQPTLATRGALVDRTGLIGFYGTWHVRTPNYNGDAEMVLWLPPVPVVVGHKIVKVEMDGPGTVNIQADIDGDGVLDNVEVAVEAKATVEVKVAETALMAQNMYSHVPMAPPPMAPPPGAMPAPLPPGHPLLMSLVGALDAEYVQGKEHGVGDWLESVEEPATADLRAHGVEWEAFEAFVEGVEEALRSGATNVPALAAGWTPPQQPMMGQPPMPMAPPAV